MRIHDATRKIDFSGNKFPVLKGHVKLTLRNVHNGKTEVVEGENIVTDAVKDIFENNPLGGIDYSKMMPLWNKWYGGVLCYEQAHANLDADKYYMSSDSAQKLIAHAGQAGIDVQHDDNLRAGNPTTSSFIQTENSMKQVWEWGTTHGNGTIRALSLCHTDIGDAGTGGTNYRFQNLSPFEDIKGSQLPVSNCSLRSPDNCFAQYDDNHGIFFHIGDENEFNPGEFYAQTTSFETKKVTVEIIRFPYYKAGLFETFHGRADYKTSFTVETTNIKFYGQPFYHFDYTNKVLWLFSNLTSAQDGDRCSYSNKVVNYIAIDCESETINYEGTITSDDADGDIAPIGYPLAYSGTARNNYGTVQLVKNGNYIYLPTGTANSRWSDFSSYNVTGYKIININNQADQDSVIFSSTWHNLSSSIKYGDLIVMSGMVSNGADGYPCVSQLPISIANGFAGNWAVQKIEKPSALILPIGSGNSSGTVERHLFATKFLNTTKYNLPSAITKTASQSMTIEYTLTEV